jgi:drug/metabolite transporter (DMT)-like permease
VTREKSATLLWGVRLLFAEAAALVVLTAYLVVLDFTAHADSVPIAIALTVLAALGAASVYVVARALGRRSAGARGPAIVVQLMIIASGGFFLQTGPAWAGLVLIALGAVVGLLIVLPSSTRALGVD